ncbi:endolytic transglycosylase MltG [Siminovitchia sp. FSL H7-0308]|uniref:CHASE3 domain sensor protein n=1 Tax=Siminovitchia thermophila TaxID=1245522 RepID=A0ABS2RBA4_9BACI|nr:endolytic transglycosylase MltG [Siminovitchia thermophila]MBM7716879.1 CHASE3 domain sensor protein [Siminovitchia thermophila]ONK22052.1 aminodeoxychorismate lyase [Bacillus sp. VT-16-64]
MKLNRLSSFAAGIFLATAISSAAYFTIGTEASKAPAQTKEDKSDSASKPSDEKMKAELESSGYVVQTTEEYNKSLQKAKKAAQEEIASNEPQKEVVNEVIINVTDGMTSIDVGRMLEQAKIVENAFQFTKEVEKKGVENRLRPGTYKITSEMTPDQVISTIFKE